MARSIKNSNDKFNSRRGDGSTNKSRLRRPREYGERLLLTLVLAVFLKTFFIGTYQIRVASMEPTLLKGDFIWVSKAAYGFRVPWSDTLLGAENPQRGDVVLIRHSDANKEFYVRRVLGLPGDRVSIQSGGIIAINDQTLPQMSTNRPRAQEGMSHQSARTFQESIDGHWYDIARENGSTVSLDKPSDRGPFVVSPGEVFVVGDYRADSADSRYWGVVPISQLEGEVWGLWLSVDNSSEAMGSPHFFRWDRIGKIH